MQLATADDVARSSDELFSSRVVAFLHFTDKLIRLENRKQIMMLSGVSHYVWQFENANMQPAVGKNIVVKMCGRFYLVKNNYNYKCTPSVLY